MVEIDHINSNLIRNEILNSINRKTNTLSDNLLTLQDKIGLCVMFAYKYKYEQKDVYFDKTKFFFDNIINAQTYQKTDIVNGPSSVLWLIRFLQKIEILDVSDYKLKFIRKTVSTELEKSIILNNWDYFHGALGHSLALKETKGYKDLLDYFVKKIVRDDKGNYSILSEFYNESTNIGLHAGILGILSITNMLISEGLFIENSNEVRKRVLDIIFKKLDGVNWSCFPALVERNYPAKMCWAYGELTLAVQLYISGIVSSENWLQQEAFKIALLGLRRNSLESAYIFDSCILNGSVGNYILYKSLNKAYSSPDFDKEEQNWLQLTKEILQENNYCNIDRYTGQKKSDFSLLTGLSGIYLSIADFDNEWQEYILLPNIMV